MENSAADQGSLAELDRAGADRVMLEARLAAISIQEGDGHLRDLPLSIRQAGLDREEANMLLHRKLRRNVPRVCPRESGGWRAL